MLNREKNAKEILNIACEGHSIAMIDGKLRQCSGASCSKCDFNSNINCRKNVNEWANSEYVEPQVDWSKVPVDTPILVRPTEEHAWIHRYFAKYENGSVYAWEQGATSWSVERPAYVCDWKYAKLAESEDQNVDKQD